MPLEVRFYSDSALENFKDEAEEAGFSVGHAKQYTRDLKIDGDDEERMRALVYLNGGDILPFEKPPAPRKRK